MEHILKEMNEEEILMLSSEELQKKIEELEGMNEVINGMVVSIVGKKLAEMVVDYDIDTIGIEPNYEYNDEGFAGTYMITIDGDDVSYKDESVPKYSKNAEDISYSDLQQKIDNELSPLSSIIKEDMGFDISELRKLAVKYFHAKLEQEIPQKGTQKKSTRYRV